MAVNMHLDVEGIKGESKHAKHKDQIDIDSWNWGLSQQGGFGQGGTGGGTGKANFSDLTFHKRLDKSSADLFLACASGKHLGKAVLSCRKAGGEELEYMKVTMENIIVSSIMTGGSADGNIVQETISFNFTKVKIEYNEQNEKGGKASSTNSSWNVATGQKD